MRKLILASPLLMLLGGCTFNPVPIIDAVQQAVASACAIVPTAQTIADILAKGNPALATAEAIAAAVCAAVTPKHLPKAAVNGGATGVEVNGVPARVIILGHPK